MTSLMTNASAMTALKTLTQTAKQLEATQARISTGLRVATAADNAAYWSIATTMRSDSKALSTVQDALGLGAATVDVAYTALDASKDVLDAIKTKLVASQQPGVDKSKIQAEVTQLQKQLDSIASTASFSGSNWLSVDSDAASYIQDQKIVSSFSRGNDGTLSIGTITVDTSNVALFDAGADGVGLLEAGTDLGIAETVAEAAGDGTDAAVVELFADMSAGVTFDAKTAMSFDVIVNGTTTSVTIDKATVDAALSSTDGVVADAADMATVVNQALEDAGIASTVATAAANTDAVEITHADNAATDTLEIANGKSSSNGNFFSVGDIDITNATEAEINSYIAGIDTMAENVTSAASDLGAVKSRIGLQQDFVSNLMDAIDRGVGQLVDADMNKESTRLQALQVQQQLGIQALSIANANSQNILSLFR